MSLTEFFFPKRFQNRRYKTKRKQQQQQLILQNSSDIHHTGDVLRKRDRHGLVSGGNLSRTLRQGDTDTEDDVGQLIDVENDDRDDQTGDIYIDTDNSQFGFDFSKNLFSQWFL